MGSSKGEERVSRKIDLPPELLAKSLFDGDGKRWIVREEERKTLGILSTTVFTVDQLGSVESGLNRLLQDHFNRALKSWLEEDVNPALASFSEEATPLFKECMAVGERTFRKTLITKLGVQGEKIWDKILTEQFGEIGKAWEDEKKKGSINFSSSGILPPGTRFHWQAKNPNFIYDMFCIEASPQRRTVNIFGERRRLFFPWMCFLVCFRNGQFQGFWSFYMPKSLASHKDELYFPNLPNIWKQWPHSWCLGRSQPAISMQDPNWHDTLFNWFWNSEFVERNENELVLQFWRNAKKRIPEVRNLDAWEELSEKDPQKMLKLPWLKLDHNLGDFVAKVIEWRIKENNETSQSISDRRSAVADLKKRLRERLEEELHFLGAHFSMPVDLERVTRDLLSKKLGGSFQDLSKSAEANCQSIAGSTATDFMGQCKKLPQPIKTEEAR